ncbi:MAG: 1-phosphofructokinase [Lachnospiraceae bacterium]|nr:1-phosphofructokinase [Lachnospiraceae bacterium]
MIYTVTLNPSLDYVLRVEEDIKAGLTNRSSSEDLFIGGKGINVSIILKELGLNSVALGFVAGNTGSAIIDGLNNKGIDSDFCVLPNGFSRINVKLKNNGEETEINARGPVINDSSLKELFDKLSRIKSGDIIVLAGSIPKSLPDTIYEDILKSLEGKNVRAVVDAGGPLLENVLKYKPFLIKPNKQELEELFNIIIHDNDEIVKYGNILRDKGAQNVIVSMGADGAILCGEDGNKYFCPAPDGKVKNTVGAGDSMVAGFITGYRKYNNLEEALKLGSAAGAATAFSDDLSKGEDIYDIFRNLCI